MDNCHPKNGRRHLKTLICLTLPLFVGPTLNGQDSQQSVRTLGHSARGEIIDSVMTGFAKHYVYPEIAAQMSSQIQEKYRDQQYDEMDDLGMFTRQLTRDLRKISEDRHIWISVMSSSDFAPAIGDTLTQDEIASRLTGHCSFKKVEWLPGNVGYLRFDRFEDPVYAGPTAVAAINFLANCDAVIIDLRENGGGEEKMVRLLSSYFYKEPLLLNSLYFTETDSLEQSWSYAYVPGRKLVNADLYVLTSEGTASGAEAFSYSLQNYARATIVGETTAGAAHWSEYWDFPNLHVRAKIPIARPIHPVTKGSWEGSGVTPNISVPAEQALDKAYQKALKTLLEKTDDDDAERSFALTWAIDGLNSKLDPVNLDENVMASYIGQYGPGTITLENGELYYQHGARPKFRMIPINRNYFRFDEAGFVRLRVITDENSAPTRVQLLFEESSVEELVRTN
jgi:hypothetical protein